MAQLKLNIKNYIAPPLPTNPIVTGTNFIAIPVIGFGQHSKPTLLSLSAYQVANRLGEVGLTWRDFTVDMYPPVKKYEQINGFVVVQGGYIDESGTRIPFENTEALLIQRTSSGSTTLLTPSNTVRSLSYNGAGTDITTVTETTNAYPDPTPYENKYFVMRNHQSGIVIKLTGKFKTYADQGFKVYTIVAPVYQSVRPDFDRCVMFVSFKPRPTMPLYEMFRDLNVKLKYEDLTSISISELLYEDPSNPFILASSEVGGYRAEITKEEYLTAADTSPLVTELHPTFLDYPNGFFDKISLFYNTEDPTNTLTIYQIMDRLVVNGIRFQQGMTIGMNVLENGQLTFKSEGLPLNTSLKFLMVYHSIGSSYIMKQSI